MAGRRPEDAHRPIEEGTRSPIGHFVLATSSYESRGTSADEAEARPSGAIDTAKKYGSDRMSALGDPE